MLLIMGCGSGGEGRVMVVGSSVDTEQAQKAREWAEARFVRFCDGDVPDAWKSWVEWIEAQWENPTREITLLEVESQREWILCYYGVAQDTLR